MEVRRPRFCCCLVLLTLVAMPATAQSRSLLLREAVAFAVQRNPTLAAAQSTVAAARAEMVSARGLDDPVLSANVALEHTRRAPGAIAEERAVDGVGAGLSLLQPLPIGGRAGLHLDASARRTEFAADAAGVVPSTATHYTPSLLLSFEQPLLRGMGVEVARKDRRLAHARRELASAEHQLLTISIVRDVVQSYWTLAHAQGHLEIQRGSAAAAREQLERVRANVAVGKLPPSATAEIEVALALREDAVQGAAQLVSERTIALRRLCGLAPDTELTAAERLPPIGTARRRSRGEDLFLALSSSPGLYAARGSTRAARVELQVAEDEQLPQLDFALAGGLIANAPTVRRASEQLTGFAGYTALAELTLELPISGHRAQGAAQAARAAFRRSEFREQDVRAQIAEGVAQASTRRDTARQRAQLLAPAEAAAELDLASEQARFDSGRGSNFDVLRRQDALAAMRLRVLSARFEWNQATASLEALTGEILTRHGVVLGAGSE